MFWGVYLFFAISGLLICTRILDEEEVSGKFRLKYFYIRRFFRIQPAAWTYLALIALLTLLGIAHESWRSWFASLFLYQNFLYTDFAPDQVLYRSALTGHFWTLAVEEHFYILLSAVLAWITQRRVVAIGALFVVLLLLNRFLIVKMGVDPAEHPRASMWVLPFLVFPALLAVLLRNPKVMHYAQVLLTPWVAFTCTAVAILFYYLRTTDFSFSFVSFTTLERSVHVLFYAFSMWVVATMLHPNSWTSRFLELKPLRFVGRLSYSLYLWHVLFLLSAQPQAGITWRPLVLLSLAPWRYVATIAAALTSYYCIERPLIRLGHRLAPPVTPGHADLRVSST